MHDRHISYGWLLNICISFFCVHHFSILVIPKIHWWHQLSEFVQILSSFNSLCSLSPYQRSIKLKILKSVICSRNYFFLELFRLMYSHAQLIIGISFKKNCLTIANFTPKDTKNTSAICDLIPVHIKSYYSEWIIVWTLYSSISYFTWPNQVRCEKEYYSCKFWRDFYFWHLSQELLNRAVIITVQNRIYWIFSIFFLHCVKNRMLLSILWDSELILTKIYDIW